MATMAFKVWGTEGHRQRESFNPSYWYDFSNEHEGTRILEVFNSDLTGSNLYTVVRITRDTEGLCWDEIDGQITDGIFENSATGRCEDVTEEYSFDKVPHMGAELEGE